MSEDVAQSYHDGDGVTKQAVHSRHQSVWMSHWMSSTSCNSTTKQACGQLSICYESQEEANHDPKQHRLLAAPGKPLNALEYERRTNEITETRSVGLMDESLIPRSDKLRSSFPMFNLQRKGDNTLAWKNERPSNSQGRNLKSQTDHDSGYQLVSLGGSEKHFKDLSPMLQWVHDAKSPSREKPECILDSPEAELIGEDNKLAMEKSLKGDFVVSSSKIIPYGFNFGKTPVRSMCKQEEVNRSKSILESEEQATNTVYHSNSMFLLHEKAVNNLFGRSRNPLARQTEADLLPRDPSTSRSQQPEFFVKQYHKMQEHAGIGLFRSKNNPMELTKSENLYHGCFPLPSLQRPMRDMDAMRACTTVDSVEESSGGCKKFSTTHHFLFKKTDINLTGGSMLKDSVVSTKLKEKCSPELFDVEQDNAFPIKTGVKLQPLGSSKGNEGEKDAREFRSLSVNLRNETSSETNTMDLDTFRKNYVSGVISSSSNKLIELEQQSPMSQAVLDSTSEIRVNLQKRKLPDINQPPNDRATCASSTDTSTSRTQSLDAENLLLNAERPESFKSNIHPAGCLESEPSRWVKRLKLCSTSAGGTQSSKMGEDTSHEKVNNIFGKMMKFSMTSSDRITGHSHGKEPIGLDQRATLWNGKSPSIESIRKNQEVTLSHPWIRRLCRNPVASLYEASKAAAVSKPQCLKASIDKRQKQYPSLAAMGLMGKAIGEFQSCQFRKKGSVVVWNF